MSNYDNRGQVSLWSHKSDNAKAPSAKGKVVAHRTIQEGEEVDIALWRNQSDNPKAPTMTGKISDPYQKQSNSSDYRAASTGSAQADDSSDLPF